MGQMLETFIQNEPELYKLMRRTEHFHSNGSINPYHVENDVWAHTCMVYSHAKGDLGKFVALTHDTGKCFVREETEDKVFFRGHEGVSAYLSLDIIKHFDLTKTSTKRAFKTIALHGRWDVNHYEKSKDIFDNTAEVMLFCDQMKADAKGRISLGESRSDEIPDPLYLSGIDINHGYMISRKSVYVLIGPPNCGKSTWTESREDTNVLSRDEILMELFSEGRSYNETWKSLSNEDQKRIDQELMKRFHSFLKEDKDLVIDMTNMSKKSRKKWMNDIKRSGKNSVAVVFATSFRTIMERNSLREGKELNQQILVNMMKNFSYPEYGEGFNRIDFILDGERVI